MSPASADDHSISRSSVSKADILRSAREQIEEKGVLGLRVAEVAKGANCSLTQIYRYFGDRDGLLAQVLGDIYEESLYDGYNKFMARVKKLPQITVEDLVQMLPTPSQYAVMVNQEVRLQILATSGMNSQLRHRIEASSQLHIDDWEAGLDYIEEHMAPGEVFDRRMFSIMLLVQTMYYRTLLGDRGFTDEEYQQFLRDKMGSK
jgi:AcrR family transcriptional regulator